MARLIGIVMIIGAVVSFLAAQQGLLGHPQFQLFSILLGILGIVLTLAGGRKQ